MPAKFIGKATRGNGAEMIFAEQEGGEERKKGRWREGRDGWREGDREMRRERDRSHARSLLPHGLTSIPAHRPTPLGERRNVEGTTRNLRQDLAVRSLQLLYAPLP